MRRLSQLRDDSGQVLIIAALCMTALIGFVGLAIDIGSVRYEQRRLQNAADATALAAALEVRVCGGTANCDAMQKAVQNAMIENGYSNATFVTDCSTTVGAGVTVMVNNPTCIVQNWVDAAHTQKRLNYVETQITERAPLRFSSLFGYNKFIIKARAQAARGVGGPCIYALNPTDPGTLNLAVAVGLQAKCGVVVESKDPNSVFCLVGLAVTAPEVQVSPTGGTASLLCLGNTRVKRSAVPIPADPLAYLPAPANANDPCGSGRKGNVYNGSPAAVDLSLLSNVTLNPGVYCGGISLTAAVLANIKFNPGTYILRDATVSVLGIPFTQGGFNITVGALTTITGSGVTFYNEGNLTNPSKSVGGFSLTLPTLPLGLSNFALSAPTSGNYGGILFWQAKNVTNTGTFVAPALLSSQQLNGIIYEPGAMVSYAVAALTTANGYNGIVADKVQYNVPVLSTFSNDFSSLQSGSPLGGDRSVLVQ